MSGSKRSRSRSRSRSQSPTLTNQSTNSKASHRRRSRSPSEKSYSDESFYSEASRKNAKSDKKKPPPKGPNKKGVKGNAKNSSRHSSVVAGPPQHGIHGPVSRVMSANRLRIQELRNRVTELADQLIVQQQENRDLKRLIRKQERKIDGYEQQENGMPRIMQRQADETQMLRDQLRQQKERCDKKSKKLKEKEDEIERMRRLVKKMQGLVDDKKLMERKKLSEKLKETEDRLHKEEEKNQTLERHLQHLGKNHKHQLATERTKEQELERQIEKLQEKYDKLEIDSKEKDKERTLQNIYSNRSMRPPHRLDSSLHSSSQLDLGRTSKPRPGGRERVRVDEKQRRAGGSGDLTGRTEDYNPRKVDRKHEDPLIPRNRGEERGYQESQTSVYKADERREKEKDSPRDKEKNTARERESERRNEDPLSWLLEERKREQELERRNWLEAKEKEDAKREREEERKREEEERRREQERRRQEERQREEEEERRKEQEEKRRNEYNKQPTRHQNQEQNHFDDRNNNKNDREIPKKVKKEEEEEDRFVKDDLLAKLRAIDEGKQDGMSASSTRKEYNFTEPVNNLHQGLPAHGQRKPNIFEDENFTFGNYRPSFVLEDSKMTKTGDSRASNKPELGNKNKKSDPFAEIFPAEPKRASNARQESPVMLELGGSTAKAKPNQTQLRREKQAIVPVFRSTANKLEVSDEEVEELAI